MTDTVDITLLRDLVAVITEKKEEVLESGIIIPEKAQEQPEVGTVVAVGPGAYSGEEFVPTTVKVGDRILFNKKYAGEDFDIKGTKVNIFAENIIIGILR